MYNVGIDNSMTAEFVRSNGSWRGFPSFHRLKFACPWAFTILSTCPFTLPADRFLFILKGHFAFPPNIFSVS
jgi:hypothetical protein